VVNRYLARGLSALALCIPLVAGAVITNPAPGTFGADDGTFKYTPGVDTFFFEAFDAMPSLGIAASFGFYRVADPAIRVTVYDAADQGPPDQTAYANFTTGGVLDLDANAVQGAFAPGFGAIGFFLQLDFGGPTLLIFSDPGLNAGFDLMAAFPALGVPGAYMIGVELPDGVGGFSTVYFASVSGFVPAQAVPEPPGLALVLLALALAAPLARTKSRR
jgi:hypothetical protein